MTDWEVTGRVSFINYFDPKDTLVFLDEPARLAGKRASGRK